MNEGKLQELTLQFLGGGFYATLVYKFEMNAYYSLATSLLRIILRELWQIEINWLCTMTIPNG